MSKDIKRQEDNKPIVIPGEEKATAETSPNLLKSLKLWILWNLVTDIGSAIALFFIVSGWMLAGALHGGGNDLGFPFTVSTLSGLLGGFLMGLCQGTVVRSRISRVNRWYLATSLAGAVCGGISAIVVVVGIPGIPSEFLNSSAVMVGLVAVGGGIFGLAQWFILKREAPGAGWWILASVIGWAGAAMAVMVLANTGLVESLGLVAGSTIIGMVTGIALLYLFEQSSQRRFSIMASLGLTLTIIIGVGLLITTGYSPKFVLKGHTDSVWAVAFSPDGTILASGSWDETIKLWNVASGSEIRTFTGHTDYIDKVAFSSDGKLLASAAEGEVRLWDIVSGKQVRVLKENMSLFDGLAFSPDGTMLSASGPLVGVRLWDLASGQEVHHWVGQGVASFSPDGKLLSAGDSGGTVRVWNIASGQEVYVFLREHTSNIVGVAFSPDGKLLASAADSYDQEQAVIVWDVTTGKKVWIFGGKHLVVEWIAFSPDGRLMMLDSNLRLWDVLTGKKVGVLLRGDPNKICPLALSPDWALLASSCLDEGAIRIWDVTGKR